jgi:BlaI family transcriptional regulator, penicillinase repressor
MERSPANITEAEWAVLEVLWDKGPATVRQLTDVLYPKGGPSEYATVHKLLERLDGKDCVRRKRQEGSFVFEASRSRDELFGEQFEALLGKMKGGSLQPLLSTLVRNRRVTADELRELLALVEQLDAKRKKKR